MLIFGHTNCVTFLFSKSLNEFLLIVLLHRNTFDKVAATTQIDQKKKRLIRRINTLSQYKMFVLHTYYIMQY